VQIERHARAAVTELWTAQPKVSGYVAELALRQVRDTLTPR